jgi:hypothetical protein
MLFKEIITLYTADLVNPLSTLCGQDAELLNVRRKAGGMYIYHWALKGKVFPEWKQNELPVIMWRKTMTVKCTAVLQQLHTPNEKRT